MAKPEFEGGRFYGAILNQWRVGNLRFSESIYPPGTQIKRHVHPRSYFSILFHTRKIHAVVLGGKFYPLASRRAQSLQGAAKRRLESNSHH